MKKIMQINITCGRGSTGKLAQALYEASLREGYEARFAYSAYTPTLQEAFPIETITQNYLRRGMNRFLGRKQHHSTPGTKRLIGYIRREKPDLIHLHNVQQNSVNYHLLFPFLQQAGIPVVFTLHDCWAFTGGCFHFAGRNCAGYTNGCEQCPLAEHPDDVTRSASSAYACKSGYIGNNDRVHPVCVSRWLCDCARSSYMGKMAHIPEMIYNGINTEVFSPRESDVRQRLGIPEDRFLILSVASFWNDDKGLTLLCQLSRMLPDEMMIVLVGQGLERVTEEKIRCLSGTENQIQLVQLYSAADVFINGSREETFGLTTAEALACGTPAIVFDATACPEIVDEQTGYVVDYDVGSVFQAIQDIKNKGKFAFHDQCIKRAKTLFDEKRMVREYMELYRRILHDE